MSDPTQTYGVQCCIAYSCFPELELRSPTVRSLHRIDFILGARTSSSGIVYPTQSLMRCFVGTDRILRTHAILIKIQFYATSMYTGLFVVCSMACSLERPTARCDASFMNDPHDPTRAFKVVDATQPAVLEVPHLSLLPF